MDRHMLKALEARYGYDRETHETTLLRNRRQAEHLPRPAFPATGTTLIAARLADARRLRDLALVEAFTEGGGAAPRTATPGDNVIRGGPVGFGAAADDSATPASVPVVALWRRAIVDRTVGMPAFA